MDVLISADQVLVGRSREPVRDATVHIRDRRIAAVGRADEIAARAPGDAVRLGFPGATVLPGLIDSHVHLAFDGGPDPAATVQRSADEALLPTMAANARRALDGGVTTVRDLGDRGYLAIRLRELVRAGRLAGPRIVASGPPLTVPGGHCWFLGGEVADEAGIRLLIERNAAAGADVIKVMATGGHLTPNGPAMADSQFTREQLASIVAAASAFDLPVAAHAHGTRGIADAVAAGARTIEHCSWIGDGAFEVPDEVIAEIVSRDVVVSPAISRNWRTFPRTFGAEPAEQLLGRLKWMDEQGVRLVAGTDSGVPGAAFGSFVSALEVYRHVGFGNERIIELATTAAAAALGLENATGRIAEGLAADLVVVDGDPLADLGALHDARLVVAEGRLHFPAAPRTGSRDDDQRE